MNKNRMFLLGIILSIICSISAQTEVVYLRNTLDTTKIKKIKKVYSVITDTSFSSGCHPYYYNIYYPNGYRLLDTAIRIHVESEELVGYDTNSSGKKKYYLEKAIDNEACEKYLKDISYKNITALTQHYGVSKLTGAVSYFGLFSLIILTPLASIDFRNGDFDRQTFIQVGGFSAIMTGVGISMHYIFSDKTFYLSHNKNQKGKQFWIKMN